MALPLAFITNTPPVTRIFTAATVGCSALYAWLRWSDVGPTSYLTLVPGQSIFYPWTFVTSAFVETTILEFILSIVTVPAGLRYLERLWGSIEVVKFIIVTVGFSNIIAFAFNWIEFMATGNADLFLHGMQYHGQMSLQIGILVAFTQLIPEHQVQLMGFVRTRVKTTPMIHLTISTVLCFVGFQCPWIIIQFGWYVSWVYLRFYKKNTSEVAGGMDTYGDRSETFSLVSWFPPFIHYPLTLLGNTVYTLASRLRLIPTTSSDLESGIYNQVPGSARAEAERRRAMALKALDQRMANSNTPSSGSSLANVVSTSPRPPPEAAAPPSEPPKSARKKSVAAEFEGEADIGESKSNLNGR